MSEERPLSVIEEMLSLLHQEGKHGLVAFRQMRSAMEFAHNVRGDFHRYGVIWDVRLFRFTSQSLSVLHLFIAESDPIAQLAGLRLDFTWFEPEFPAELAAQINSRRSA